MQRALAKVKYQGTFRIELFRKISFAALVPLSFVLSKIKNIYFSQNISGSHAKTLIFSRIFENNQH